MFQFTTTNVINSAYAVDYDGSPLLDSTGTSVDKVKGSATQFFVAKVNTFKKANIESIFKRGYTAGVKEVATVTVPIITAGLSARIEVNIRYSNKTFSKFTNWTWDFQEPTVVEIISSGVAATDATAFAAQLNKLKTEFGTAYFTAGAAGAVITITATEATQRIDRLIVSKEQVPTNSFIFPENLVVATGVVTVNGVEGFGDNNWMARSIMLPTAENVRAFGMSKEERPILGGNYSQYIIRYKITPLGQDGIVSGNQSITTHIFWVLSTLVTGFETELNKLGLSIGIKVTAASAAILNSATTQLTTINPTGIVTYSITSGTSATVDQTGLVTGHATIDGVTVVRATDVINNYSEVSITVS